MKFENRNLLKITSCFVNFKKNYLFHKKNKKKWNYVQNIQNMGQDKIKKIENEKWKIRNLQMKNEKNERGGEKDGKK